MVSAHASSPIAITYRILHVKRIFTKIFLRHHGIADLTVVEYAFVSCEDVSQSLYLLAAVSGTDTFEGHR